MKILFRVNANAVIGMGHLMRCLTVATELKRKRVECLFAVTEEREKNIINNKGFDAYQIANREDGYGKLDAFELIKFARKMDISLIVVDSYKINNEYLEHLKKEFLLAAFHCAENELLIDLLINYNIDVKKENIRALYKDKNVKCLLGSAFVPLREEFKMVDYTVLTSVKNVLVMAGGADSNNFLGKFLKQVQRRRWNEKVVINCLIGKYNANYEQILKIASGECNINLINHTENMAELIKSNDLIISAGGTSLYEICSIGAPAVIYSLADNQLSEAQYMGEHNMIEYAGSIFEEGFWTKFWDAVEKLSRDYELRKARSIKMKTLVDCNGAKRIAEELIRVGRKNMDFNFEQTKEYWGNEIQQGRLIWPNEHVIRFVKRNIKDKEQTILDFGCGAGRNAIALAQEGYKVIAMDYNEQGLEILKQRMQQENYQIQCMVNEGIEVPLEENSVSAIVAVGSLFYYKKDMLVNLLKNLRNCTKKEGLFWADWRSVGDSMCGQGEQIEQGLYILKDSTNRGGCNYFFAEKDDLMEMYTAAGWEIVSIDKYSYTSNNMKTNNEWFHVVARN